MADFAEFVAKLDGRRLTRHAVLTFAGTWAPPGVGYPSDVVNGLAQYVDPMLCYEVPVLAPNSFGPLGGDVMAPSYQESVRQQIEFAGNYVVDNPDQTVIGIGYSQGGEGCSRWAMEFEPGGQLEAYRDNFVGGITFGNPCRMAGSHASTIADPGGRGIASTLMASLPTIDGRVVWADYVHSPANGDAGRDMYASVPDNQVGEMMTLVYGTATNVQLHDLGALTTTVVNALVAGVNDLGLLPGQSTANLLTSPSTELLSQFNQIVVGQPEGIGAAVEAAIEGIKFLAAPGGPTAPHISYLGEIGGYSNQVADAVGFLHDLATAVPARAAA